MMSHGCRTGLKKAQTANLELQKWKGGNHKELKWSQQRSWEAQPGAEAAQLRLCPQNPLILLMAMGIEQVKTEASKEQAVT